MAARVGFEPATFRTQGTEPATEPPRRLVAFITSCMPSLQLASTIVHRSAWLDIWPNGMPVPGLVFCVDTFSELPKFDHVSSYMQDSGVQGRGAEGATAPGIQPGASNYPIVQNISDKFRCKLLKKRSSEFFAG